MAILASGLSAQIVGDVSCNVTAPETGILQADYSGGAVSLTWLPDSWCPLGGPPASISSVTVTAPCAALPLETTYRSTGYAAPYCTAVPTAPATALTQIYLGTDQ